ncbi:MAG: hypothetical protein GY724_29850 [Actinomycetia bacterium]|nr:hypothetical protein [Actinomycetes bacterium]
MRRTKRSLIPVLACVLLLASCGSSDDGDDSGQGVIDQQIDNSQAEADDEQPATGDEQANGDIDCVALQEALVTVGVGVQLLAQLRSQAQYDAVQSGAVLFDPDDFDAALVVLRPLDDYDKPLGSVDEALDYYGEANALARQNLAVEDPFTEAKGEELAAMNEDLTDFLSRQSAISYAKGEAGC